MSRLEEVEAEIISADGAYHDGAWIGPESLRYLARTLAVEVDARDKIISDLLAMLKPGVAPNPADAKYNPTRWLDWTNYQYDSNRHSRMVTLYNRALEIAGRENV